MRPERNDSAIRLEYALDTRMIHSQGDDLDSGRLRLTVDHLPYSGAFSTLIECADGDRHQIRVHGCALELNPDN